MKIIFFIEVNTFKVVDIQYYKKLTLVCEIIKVLYKFNIGIYILKKTWNSKFAL